jgi:hypothetical protein
MSMDELDKMIEQKHQEIIDQVRAELGQETCPELIKIKAWTVQISDAVTRLMDTIYQDPRVGG